MAGSRGPVDELATGVYILKWGGVPKKYLYNEKVIWFLIPIISWSQCDIEIIGFISTDITLR